MTTTDIEYLINDQSLAAAVDSALQTAPLINRVAASGIRPVHNGFKEFVRGDSFGISEVAIVTILQAIALDRPVLFLPLTALGRYQHQTLISVESLAVADLPDRTVGVRSWSQTTGMWVRGILSQQYGVDLSSVKWRTYEGGHLDDIADPTWVQHAPEGAKLAEDLLDGTVDVAIMGNDRPSDPRVRDVIPDAKTVASAWAAEVGYIPVNHVFGVRADLAREQSDAVLRAYDAVAEVLASKQDASSQSPAIQPFGFAGLQAAVTAAAEFGREQGLLPRPVSYDEIVENTSSALGVQASRLGA
jgi:4,5-dihydroxyphthalate decarboxylase